MAMGCKIFQDPLTRGEGVRPGTNPVEQSAGKPAREVRVGDQLQIKNEGGDFHVEVLGLSDVAAPPASPKLSTGKLMPAVKCA